MSKDIETTIKILNTIAKDSEVSQRDIAKAIGVSLGKVNYVLKALIAKGFIKTENFLNNKNKWAYKYILTPKGMKQKVKITREFVKSKIEEYEALLREEEDEI